MADLIGGINVWGVVKILALFGLGIYGVFALVVVRQVMLMVTTLDGSLTPVLRVVAWLHLAAAIALFVFAVVLL